MLATFWDKLFEYKDKVKKEYGKKSAEYKTVHEIEDILQEAYDECNRIKDITAINVRPKSENDRYIFEKLPEVRVCEDKDGYYFMLDGMHFETASEVFDYIIRDRRQNYKELNARYNNMYKDACSQLVKKLYSETKQSFMESLDYEEGDYLKGCTCTIRDAKGSEEK